MSDKLLIDFYVSIDLINILFLFICEWCFFFFCLIISCEYWSDTSNYHKTCLRSILCNIGLNLTLNKENDIIFKFVAIFVNMWILLNFK